MNNTLTTKTFWGIVTVGLWIITGVLTFTKVIDFNTFLGSLTTTGAIAFGMYQMYNRIGAEDTIERQAEMIQHQSIELHKLHIDNSKLQAQTKIPNINVNETKEQPVEKKKSNKKPRK